MEQLHRVQRYLDRIREIYKGCAHRFDRVEYYEDDVITFFIHCHHLLDWLVEHNSSGFTKTDLNRFINRHEELRICADLCNGKKHCSLKQLRSGSLPSMVKRSWMILTYKNELNKPTTFVSKYEIHHDNNVYDALELAENCMKLWRDKIRKMALKAI